MRVFDQTSDLSCPLCAAPLMHTTLARQRILYCTHCRGSLIPVPVFVALLDVLRARRGQAGAVAPPPDPHQLDRVIYCPQCQRRMDTNYYAGGGRVVIDDCSPCELNWLDAGELTAILDAPDYWCDSRIRIDES